MGVTVEKIVFDASTADLAAGKIARVEGALGGAQKASSSLARSVGGLAAAYVGVNGLISAVTQGVRASRDQAQANRILAVSYQGNTSELLRYAATLQQQTGISDNLIVRQQAMIAALGFNEQQIKDITKAALGLNAAFGLELNSSIRNLIKMYSGMKGELSEAIPQIRALSEEMLRSGKGTEVVLELVSGALSEAKDELTDLNNEWQDFMENVGGPVVSVLGALGRSVATIAGEFTGVYTNGRAVGQMLDRGIGQVVGYTGELSELEKQTIATAAAIREMREIRNAFTGPPAPSDEELISRAEQREREERAREAIRRSNATPGRDAEAIRASLTAAHLQQQRALRDSMPADMMDPKFFNDSSMDQAKLNDDIAASEERLAASRERVVRTQRAAADADKARLNTMGALAGSLAGLNAAFKGSAQVTKRLMQVQAVVDTYAAANSALATVKPFPLAIVAAATAVASGLANVANIQAQKFARGGDFETAGPRLIMVGDNPGGRERVQITPTSSPNYEGPQGGTTFVINATYVDQGALREFAREVERIQRRRLA